jgi:hypothetical protein
MVRRDGKLGRMPVEIELLKKCGGNMQDPDQ